MLCSRTVRYTTVMRQQGFRLGYRPELDGLRGVAVLAVVLFHGLNTLHTRWFVGGFLGVDVFFVLSGFLITAKLVQEWERAGVINLPHFYLRRVCRLLPALASVLICVSAIALRAQGTPIGAPVARVLWRAIVGALFYVANWQMALGFLPPHMLSMTWTLAIEEQFYLAWPLTLLLLLRRGWARERLLWLALGIAATANLWRVALKLDGATWIRLQGTDAAAGGLLLGCAVALMAASGMLPKASRRLGLTCWAGAIGLLALIATAHSPLDAPPGSGLLSTLERLAASPLADLAAAAVLVGLLALPAMQLHRVLRLKPLTWFGHISYGLYLWHAPLLWLWPHTPVSLLVWFVVSVGTAAVSYYTIERTFSKIGGRFRESMPVPSLHPALAGDD